MTVVSSSRRMFRSPKECRTCPRRGGPRLTWDTVISHPLTEVLSGGQGDGSQVLVSSFRTSVQCGCDIISCAVVVFTHRRDGCCVGWQNQASFIQHTAWYGCDVVPLLSGVWAGCIPTELGGLFTLEDLGVHNNKLTGMGVCSLVG